jgi:hypothetical protein
MPFQEVQEQPWTCHTECSYKNHARLRATWLLDLLVLLLYLHTGQFFYDSLVGIPTRYHEYISKHLSIVQFETTEEVARTVFWKKFTLLPNPVLVRYLDVSNFSLVVKRLTRELAWLPRPSSDVDPIQLRIPQAIPNQLIVVLNILGFKHI